MICKSNNILQNICYNVCGQRCGFGGWNRPLWRAALAVRVCVMTLKNNMLKIWRWIFGGYDRTLKVFSGSLFTTVKFSVFTNKLNAKSIIFLSCFIGLTNP